MLDLQLYFINFFVMSMIYLRPLFFRKKIMNFLKLHATTNKQSVMHLIYLDIQKVWNGKEKNTKHSLKKM